MTRVAAPGLCLPLRAPEENILYSLGRNPRQGS